MTSALDESLQIAKAIQLKSHQCRPLSLERSSTLHPSTTLDVDIHILRLSRPECT